MSEKKESVTVTENLTPAQVTANEHNKKIMESYNTVIKMMDIINDNQSVNTAYSQIYSKTINSRREMIRAVDGIKPYYLTQVIVDQIINDAFAPDIKTNEILSIKAALGDNKKNKELQAEVDYLEDLFGFDQFSKDATKEALYYGDYTISTRLKQGEGLIDLIDDTDQEAVIPLVKHSRCVGYLILDEKKSKVKVVDRAKYVKFSLNDETIRIDTRKELSSQYNIEIDKNTKDEIPRYIRIGKSLVYPVIDKIKDLDLLERLVPRTKLKKISNGTLVGLQVPQGYSPTEALKFCETVEGIINKKVGVDQTTGIITAQNIIESADLFKVVPIYGNIGDVKPMNYSGDEPDKLLESVDKIRMTILDSIPIPSESIFHGFEGGDNKGSSTLKRYARYLRRLKSVQQMVVNALKEIIFIHLANKDKKKWKGLKSTDIDVVFINDLIEIDNLDRLEFLDTTISFIKNTTDFVNELADVGSPYSQYVNRAEFVKWMKEQLSTVNLNIIQLDGKNKPIAANGDQGGEVNIDKETSDMPGEGETPSTGPVETPEPELGPVEAPTGDELV